MLFPVERKVSFRSTIVSTLRIAISASLLGTIVIGVAYRYGFNDISGYLHRLSPLLVSVILAGLLANAMAAVLRFRVLASDAGHPIGWRRGMAAVGAGSLAGALFFQIAGQLMARGVVMRRGGVPFGAVVVVTLYERIVSAVVSGLIALLGAAHIFGRVYLDQSAGGGQLLKLMCGVVAALGFAGWLGFGGLVKQNVWPLLTREFVRRLLRVAALTVLVQLPMMGAYVVLAHEFSSRTSIADLVAASAVVMFAASVPISLAGWGVRELSAVVALGAIGMPASGALTTAIIIGAGSLLAMGAIFALSMHNNPEGTLAAEADAVTTTDYSRALGWVLPLLAAVFVLFQVYLPVGSGLINANLADPIAILGGSLFVLRAIGRKQLPLWRVEHVNLFVLLGTLALGLSLLIGASRFGWTNWALINRFAGWFILLAYAATGALITSLGDLRAFRVFILTSVGAAIGIILIDYTLVLAFSAGLHVNGLILPSSIDGFAQNRNAFAFQLLMLIGGVIIFLKGRITRQLVLSAFICALWLAGSRSGWISLFCIFAAALYFRYVSVSELLKAGFLAAAFAAVPVLIAGVPAAVDYLAIGHISAGHLLFGHGDIGGAHVQALLPDLMPERGSTSERVLSLVRGFQLFRSHPLFGAGLGAFTNLGIKTDGGLPLVIHSSAVWLLAELGIVGFLIFVVSGAYVLFGQWRIAARDQAAAVITLCFIGFLVMSGPADMMYQRTFWLLIGAALAVAPAIASGQRGFLRLKPTRSAPTTAAPAISANACNQDAE